MSELVNGNQQWVDSGGNPIVNGKIFIGTQGNEPEANPKAIFSNRALSAALTNPQLIDSNGFSVNKIWLTGTYSIKVVNSASVTLIQELDNGLATTSASLNTVGSIAGTNTITGVSNPTITSYTDLAIFTFQTVGINTGDITLNIDGVGAKAIKKNLTIQIPGGQFEDNQDVMVIYNKSEDIFEWVNHNNKVDFLNLLTLASAATTSIFDSLGNYLSITGTTTITSFGTAPVIGSWRILKFATALLLTDGANLEIPGSANLTTAAGDYCMVVAESTTVHRIVWYQKLAGGPILFEPLSVTTAAIAALAVTTAKIALNNITEPLIGAGAIDQTGLGALAVGQGECKTAIGEVSTMSTTGVHLTMAGGEYGFYPRSKIIVGTAGTGLTQIGNVFNNTSRLTQIWLRITISDGTNFAQQRYFQASPPYDLGDGDVHSFLFAVMNSAGLIESTYFAPDPPWANNGPTNIRPDRVEILKNKAGKIISEKSYKTISKLNPDLTKFMDPDFLQESEMEITAQFKNSDMGLIPHPFQSNNMAGKTIVMFDPMSPVIKRLEEIKEAGGDPYDIILGNYLKIGNTELGRGRPSGVMSVSVGMK